MTLRTFPSGEWEKTTGRMSRESEQAANPERRSKQVGCSR